jgi:hypothetical protein
MEDLVAKLQAAETTTDAGILMYDMRKPVFHDVRSLAGECRADILNT